MGWANCRSPALSWATQSRSVSGLIPNCSSIRTHVLGRDAGSHASSVNRIALPKLLGGTSWCLLLPPWLEISLKLGT